MLTHTVRGDEAGWGRTGVSALRYPLWFHFSCFSYSQSTTVWKCYKECSRHNNWYIFILFHFSFLRQILTVAQDSFKLLPQPPSPEITGVCHHIWPIHKFVILYYNTLLLIVFYCYSLTVCNLQTKLDHPCNVWRRKTPFRRFSTGSASDVHCGAWAVSLKDETGHSTSFST